MTTTPTTPVATAANEGRPLVGIALVTVAAFTFALGDTVTKHLTATHPVAVVVAVRYLINVALLVAFLWPKQRARLWQTQRTGLVLLRGLCLALASLTMGSALRLMPVGETVAILYVSPFIVMFLSAPVLGEKVGSAAWVGAALGFLGVLLIVRPGGGLDPLGVFFALTNAGLATAYLLLTRLLGRTETMISMLFHTAWVGAVFFCVLAFPLLGTVSASMTDVGFMLLLGLSATIGHFLFTAAYREAPASLLAPVNYLHLVWAGGLGWLVFGHIPDGLSLVGMALVSGAGMAIAFLSHRHQRRARPVVATPGAAL